MSAPERTRAQQWAQIAIRFIASGTVTGVFALLSYLLWTSVAWIGKACAGIAAVAALVFLSASLSIVRWWIVLARAKRGDHLM